MLKREYTNIFVTSGNPDTLEISISFKQEGTDLNFNPDAESRIWESKKELFDVAAIVMTLENAKQFLSQLNDMVNKMIIQDQEKRNGEPISSN